MAIETVSAAELTEETSLSSDGTLQFLRLANPDANGLIARRLSVTNFFGGTGSSLKAARSDHTHTYNLDQIGDGATNRHLTNTLRTKLLGIADGATVGATWGVNISGQPSLATVATTGSYADLSGKPSLPTTSDDLANNSNVDSGAGTVTSALNTLLASGGGGGTSDHGSLTGLGDDDHSQYHTDARAATWLAGASVDINGGAIDGTAIGGTVPAAGTFTTIAGNGAALTNVPFPTVKQLGVLTTAPNYGESTIYVPAALADPNELVLPDRTGNDDKIIEVVNTTGQPLILIDFTQDAVTTRFKELSTGALTNQFTLNNGEARRLHAQAERWNVYPGPNDVQTESNNLTQAVTWADVPDVNITQSSVKQHEGALAIESSQISDAVDIGAVTVPVNITIQDQGGSAAADGDVANDPFLSNGTTNGFYVPDFSKIDTLTLNIGRLGGSEDAGRALRLIDVNNSNAVIAGPLAIPTNDAPKTFVDVDVSAYNETGVGLCLVSAGTGAGGSTIIVTAVNVVLDTEIV